MKLTIFATLAEDINNGSVWMPEFLVSERTVIRLRNTRTEKAIYCEALPIGENYVKRYNTNNSTHRIDDKNESLVISEWYRKKLGIAKTQQEIAFEVETHDNPLGHLKASLHHPQIVVRLAMKLALLSVVLGVIGIFLGIVGASH